MKNPDHLEWAARVDAALKPYSLSSVLMGGVPCINVAATQFGAALRKIKAHSRELGLDLLEDAFAQDLGKSIHVTCRFIGTSCASRELIVRTEVVATGQKHRPALEPLSKSWPMASCFELEMATLYGLDFTGREDSGSDFSLQEQDEGAAGYPMRKYSSGSIDGESTS